MGKYMRKAKVSGEVAVMEVSHQSTLGVRTRARALAAAAAQDSSRTYLELRSRRLEKPLPPSPACKPCKDAPRPNPRGSSPKSGPAPRANSGSVGSVSTSRCPAAAIMLAPADAEVSYGENILDADARERETTPCSLIRDTESIGTLGSANRPTISTRMQTSRQNIPTAYEMEEFFAGAEQLQQQTFIERYNFDPVNDHPLPGRYEWIKIDFK
ncbi:unnamed protein product [Musa banksii]